jgi:nitrogenase molybdenum-iron protein alpha/beta subunit
MANRRKQKGAKGLEVQKEINRIVLIKKIVSSLVGAESVDVWLKARNKHLGNKAPQEYIDAGNAEIVLQYLLRFFHGHIDDI